MVVVELDQPTVQHHIGEGLFPQWSPVDDQIVFQRPRQRGTRWFCIWTIALNNNEPGRATQIAASGNAALIHPCWSPDASRIALFARYCSVICLRLAMREERPKPLRSDHSLI